MSGVLMRMEAAGMGERRKAEQDQRRVLVRLAEKGEGWFWRGKVADAFEVAQ